MDPTATWLPDPRREGESESFISLVRAIPVLTRYSTLSVSLSVFLMSCSSVFVVLSTVFERVRVALTIALSGDTALITFHHFRWVKAATGERTRTQ